ncbi:hypothetical protein K432DRAFT_436087 [Lepidopterella palustris CBS 459.81]|uniref:RRM domain-containing protein n=1 Tax=Lepidopterella palustris CBS 459.81 TaxID=1314670 RepID=A0A8E2JDN2_9PEZI|nr:hypothetical protein K432DRAFT_436087 [Lepidopterella palustris CBS 459.81]
MNHKSSEKKTKYPKIKKESKIAFEQLNNATSSLPSPEPPSKKRKRVSVLADEIEIDVNLPEPPSKKALRRAKKGKPTATAQDGSSIEDNSMVAVSEDESKPAKRSEFGVWIGNLPWSATKAILRTFLTEHTDITNNEITRVHMPPPNKSTNSQQVIKPQNRGFAYVDVSTYRALEAAIALSETLMGGRRLLIKNAKSFEGRPEKEAGADNGKEPIVSRGGKLPNKRVFVGNLGFDVTKEDLNHHYAQCGEIDDIHMATFEDTGKCKGFAWVTFASLEAAKAAVVGWIYKSSDQSEDESDNYEDEDEDGAPKRSIATEMTKVKEIKKRKWFVNRLRGRALRCEFAEDATSRYKKRFGNEGTDKVRNSHRDADADADGDIGEAAERDGPSRFPNARSEGKQGSKFHDRNFRKIDARTIKPGAALSNAKRATGAIVESKGTKITFD